MENKKYTEEFGRVISYMNDVLVKEFPTDILSVEYVILSILDVKDCHANLILESCLMSSSIKKLRETYESFLSDRTRKSVQVDLMKVKPNDEVVSLLGDLSEAECTEGEVGSEHILLAIMNPKNGVAAEKVFRSMGLKYDFLHTKSSNINKTTGSSEKKKAKQSVPQLKSEVNVKSIASTKSDFIDKYTINVNELVERGVFNKTIGREKEITQIFNTMARKYKNNVVLVGESGCGVTQVVYGFVERLVRGDAPKCVDGKKVVQLDILKLISGTSLRGMMEERVNGLFDELKASKSHILFIDDIQNTLKGSKDKDTDISEMIGSILSDGNVGIIATTSFKGYKNHIESNSQISRKMQKIVVEAPTDEQTIEILKGTIDTYEQYHRVKYSDGIIKLATSLAKKNITTRTLPDSALEVIDLAGASVSVNNGETEEIRNARKELRDMNAEKGRHLEVGDFEFVDKLSERETELKHLIADNNRNNDKKGRESYTEVTEDDIMKAVSDLSGVPVGKLNIDEKKKLASLEETLKACVIGQDDAVDAVCRVIKRNKVGLGDKSKTIANILAVGPSGVGKTLIAKKLAEEIFGSESNMIRIDMSEYSEKSSVSKLAGSSPGYVGYENGGQLTEAVKNKQHCVLLLDEIEKAHEDVYNVFLQLFDEGRLTDNAGQTVNFKNVIVIMTSNVGARQADEFGNGVGFVTDAKDNKARIIDKEIKKKFPPEFINRLDKIVHFNYLTEENLKDITKLEMDKVRKRVEDIGYKISFGEDAVQWVCNKAWNEHKYGARPIIRILQENVEDQLTDLLIESEDQPGRTFTVNVQDGEIKVA